MATSFKRWKGWNVLSAQFCVLIMAGVGFALLSGFSCGQAENTPPAADSGAPGFNVGLGFGPDPRYDGQIHGDVHNPCEYFTGGTYKIKKVTVEIFKYDGAGKPVKIYDPVTMKDGVNFLNGNPQSPIGPGMKFKIPENGAFKIKIRVWGYDCDDLEPPGQCLDCCDDEAEGPYWEEESSWQDNQKNDYARSYITYPKFIECS